MSQWDWDPRLSSWRVSASTAGTNSLLVITLPIKTHVEGLMTFAY